jgi:hypothetical protein
MSIIPGTNYTITKQKAIGKVTSVTKDPFSPLTVGRAYTGVKSFKVATSAINNDDSIDQTAHGLSSGDIVYYSSEGGLYTLKNPIANEPNTIEVFVHNNTITDINDAHGLKTGDAVYYSDGGSGSPITGLANGGRYFIIKVDDYTFKLASSFKDAGNGVEINLTGTGHDNQQFYPYVNEGEEFYIGAVTADKFKLYKTYADAIAATNAVEINNSSLLGNNNQTFSTPFGNFNPADA